MSWTECRNPEQRETNCPQQIEQVVVPRSSDLGGFEVRRALPSRHRRMVGPFVFLDQMGPNRMAVSSALDVLPHPHIGLATLTYLFRGNIEHRDSLGTRQIISPGAVNWMTAGRGIVHSERSPQAARTREDWLFGLQTWIALPRALEEIDPGFIHTQASVLPALDDAGVSLRVIVGEFGGRRSPVETYSETVYVDARLDAGAQLPVDTSVEERAAYVAEGEIEIDGQHHPAGRLLVLRPGSRVVLRAIQPSRLAILGGEPMDGPRHIWWNFVSSDRERIEQAKADWRAGRFAPVPGESGFMSLP